ncbi:hypothetical protein [Microbulbifer sediminum]|uniref:hypothetical protein n=1 Tax=Microbulbifer sediminum TaxID=2904250 RepID=UPI001F2A2157|nr:hypothetical protein [Microbulbifer sediminum]
MDAGERNCEIWEITAAVNGGITTNPEFVATKVVGAAGFTLSTLLRNEIILNKS